eukprot:TRINITY_DN4943_c0_g1_i19.p1 TRINITY_DN4943_c0_g1~~TRINITY_DN4943_c0_g1_i19.p1  ORF type:complete len:562 (-),score=108.59 TRINITY_DN4943_c0_g1_i19:128-1813(-)
MSSAQEVVLSTPARVYQMLQHYLKENMRFSDQEFQPIPRSICTEQSNPKLYELMEARWLRPDDFWGKGNYHLFDKIEPDDLIEGRLGNIYFLSSLSSLAEWPYRVQRLFLTKEVNTAGLYAVALCLRGEWKEIIVDDYFPCTSDGKGPLFSRTNGNELWVLLLEKAWAKAHGSYERIEKGIAREVLHSLTGAPTTTLFMDNPNLWVNVLRGEKENWIMTATSDEKPGVSAGAVTQEGLFALQTYSLLSAHDVQTPQGPVRLLRLRNPKKGAEWNGAWSDSSRSWTPDLLQRLNHSLNRQDGIFFMAFEDFYKHFYSVSMCMVTDSFKYFSTPVVVYPKRTCYFRLTVMRESKYFFTVCQESKRRFPGTNYTYSPVRLHLARQAGNGVDFEYISSKQEADREVWTYAAALTPGEHILAIRILWYDNAPHECVLSSYGAEPVMMTAIQKIPDFYRKSTLSRARNSQANKRDFSDMRLPGAFRVSDFPDTGFGFVYYCNRSNYTLYEEVLFDQMKNIKIRYDQDKVRDNRVLVTVPPGKEALILVKLHPNGHSFELKYEKFSAR